MSKYYESKQRNDTNPWISPGVYSNIFWAISKPIFRNVFHDDDKALSHHDLLIWLLSTVQRSMKHSPSAWKYMSKRRDKYSLKAKALSENVIDKQSLNKCQVLYLTYYLATVHCKGLDPIFRVILLDGISVSSTSHTGLLFPLTQVYLCLYIF